MNSILKNEIEKKSIKKNNTKNNLRQLKLTC